MLYLLSFLGNYNLSQLECNTSNNSIYLRNAPIVLLVRGILYAVGAGNTVIIKSSELSPRTHFILTSLIISAGFPPGVINLIGHCREDAAEITEALISQRAIRKVSFTGSAAIGKRIAALCGEHLKPVVMELGGKSPLILFEDVNIEEAAASSAFGALAYVGARSVFISLVCGINPLYRLGKSACRPTR